MPGSLYCLIVESEPSETLSWSWEGGPQIWFRQICVLSRSPAPREGNAGGLQSPLRLEKWEPIFLCPTKVEKSLSVRCRSVGTDSISPSNVSALLLVFKCIFCGPDKILFIVGYKVSNYNVANEMQSSFVVVF